MRLLDRAVSLTLPAVPRPIVRYFSRPYIAGETIKDALDVVRDLREQGAMATVDILGEFITRLDQAQANADAYQELLERIHAEPLVETHVSVKLSALGLLLDRDVCLEHMRGLLRTADRVESFVRIDMEDSECTSSTLEIYETLRGEFPGRVGAVFQSRLRRTLEDVERLAGEAGNFRLCKGIYLEPRPIAYVDAELIRDNFTLVLDHMFASGSYVGIATHDERLVWEALRLIRKYGKTRDQYEFQMLLGVDHEMRRILIRDGHRLRVYVPYGANWYKYSVRRLRENPQLAGHTLRAILGRR